MKITLTYDLSPLQKEGEFTFTDKLDFISFITFIHEKDHALNTYLTTRDRRSLLAYQDVVKQGIKTVIGDNSKSYDDIEEVILLTSNGLLKDIDITLENEKGN